MADIRNDQYLHRPTAGRGAITAQDPLEVLLHSGGQPISGTNRLPVEAALSGRARLVAMGRNEVIPPGVEIFRPGSADAPVIQAHRRSGFILTFVATPVANRRVRVNMILRRLTPDGSKSGNPEYTMGDRVNVLVADGSPDTPPSLIMEPVHVP